MKKLVIPLHQRLLLLVKGFDFSEKFYGMMNVRGYTGKISRDKRVPLITNNDTLAMLIGFLIFGITISTVIKKELLHLSIYVLILSVIVLVISSIYKQFST